MTLCDKPGCGREMVDICRYCGICCTNEEHTLVERCPRNDDAHALCAKVAELEAKLMPLVDAIVEVWPHRTNRKVTDEAKAIYQYALTFWHQVNVLGPSMAREEARKKGAEHGE